MNVLDANKLREALGAGRVEWRKHVLQRLAERGITQRAVLNTLKTGERIRDYVDDTPFASALFLGYSDGWPLHIVAAVDEENSRAFIITAYAPSLNMFEADLKTRKRT